MDRERAETYLRLQAEAELSRAAGQPRDSAARAGATDRVSRIARVLIAVGALDEAVAEQILQEFELSLGVRLGGPVGDPAIMRPPRHAPARPRAVPGHVVPVGRQIPVRDQDISGEIYLLSYAQVATRGLLTMIARADPGRHGPTEMFSFFQFAATDDRGTVYGMGLHGSGGAGPGGWILRLHPDPPPDLRWLDVTTAPGDPATRIDMSLPGTVEATASAPVASPGEQLLDAIAMQLLAVAPGFAAEVLLPVAGLRLSPAVHGIGDVIAALDACGALPPHSPVPAQLAELCHHLGVGGHGIAAPPAGELPEPWRSALSRYFVFPRPGPDPGRDDCAVAAAVLPELGGIRLAILGLYQPGGRTRLFAHASGAAIYRLLEPTCWPAVWLRDNDGRWHATRARNSSADLDHEVTMEMDVVPPLSRATVSIEVMAAAPEAQAHLTLPLRWA